MPTYDRGSAPINEPGKDVPLAPKPFKASEDDEPIVKCAKELDEAALRAQDETRTEGRQPGFTEASVNGILEKNKPDKKPAVEDGPDGEEKLATAFKPDEDGAVADLPGEESLYPAPGNDMPPGTVVLAELDEK